MINLPQKHISNICKTANQNLNALFRALLFINTIKCDKITKTPFSNVLQSGKCEKQQNTQFHHTNLLEIEWLKTIVLGLNSVPYRMNPIWNL